MSENLTTHATLLARLAQPNDRAAWNDFCLRYGELIRSFARRRGLQPADVDDVLQEVLIGLTKTMPGFEYNPAKGKFRSYLKTIVMRTIARKSYQKKPLAGQELIEDGAGSEANDPAAEALWEEEWRQHHLRLAMRAIAMEFRVSDRAAFQAYAVDGLSPQETADRLGLSVNQVYQAKSRVLKRLTELIEQQTREEG